MQRPTVFIGRRCSLIGHSSSGPYLRRVVEESFFNNLVICPALIRELVNREPLAIEPCEVKHPVNGNTISFNGKEIDRMGEYIRVLRQRRALMRHEHVTSHAWWMMVFLHSGIRRVEALNGLRVLAADHGGNECFYGLFAGHDSDLSWTADLRIIPHAQETRKPWFA